MSEAKKDPMDEARLTLANIEADIRANRDKLHQMKRAGVEHFREGLARVHQNGLNDGNVDAWCREASAMAPKK